MRLVVCLVAACGTSPVVANDAAPLPMHDAPTACVDRAPVRPAHLHAGVFTTFAGKGCVVAGCHLGGMTGIGADPFEFAGTVFGDDGVTPNQGATVRITPAAGAGAAAVTDSAGNFFLPAGTLPQPFPSHSQATVCPTVQDMPDGLISGDCNNPGCHAETTEMPIHLMPLP